MYGRERGVHAPTEFLARTEQQKLSRRKQELLEKEVARDAVAKTGPMQS